MAGGSPLRIALNATAAVTGGGVTYWLNLLPALGRLGTDHEFLVYVPATEGRLPLDLPGNFHVARVSFAKPHTLTRVLWEQFRLPGLLHRAGADVLLAPADVAPLWGDCPVVLAIRNPNPYWGPRASTLGGRAREKILRALTRRSIARAAHVFFVSEFSRRRVASLLGLDEAKTSVIYHGVAERFSARDESGQEKRLAAERRRYILCVSAIRVHKDMLTLIEAFALFREKVPSGREYTLQIAGKVIDAPFYERLQTLVREKGLKESVVFRGELSYDDLPRLYREAEVFVFPTRAETFGHPLVEAMASGTPVVATDLDVCREICGPAAVYSPAGDPHDLASNMTRLVVDREARDRLREAGRQRAAFFSWERCARETVETLEKVAGRAFAEPERDARDVHEESVATASSRWTDRTEKR